MWSRSYRRHVIMAFPSFDTATNLWAPQADISWPTGPVRESEFVRFPMRVMSEAEAVACALSKGKTWIDRHLRQKPGARHADRVPILQRLVALQKSLARPNLKPPAQIRLATPRGSADIFTFDEFKALMARRNVELSEQSLQKSYAALMKLRKNAHFSWAEIKLKVKHSQQSLTALQQRRRINAARLPLTQRDWQRIL